MKPISIVPKYFPLPRKTHAITLWPFIFFRREKYKQDRALMAHEMYHWNQALKYGVIPWYILYVILLLIYRTGGRKHPMERRAYELQREINREHY